MSVPRETHFTGAVRRPDGTIHVVTESRCADCGELLSSMHHGCCGYAASGFGTFKHDCPKKEKP
jgi:hypothetical protein